MTDISNLKYLGNDKFIDWTQKKIIKHGLAKGTQYAVFTKTPGIMEISFFGWFKRSEIKNFKELFSL